jgi:RNA polymerase sigma factor (sigma-70 family)
MTEEQWLADRFEEQRPRLRSVAYRMLGSLSEADDALQNAWLRASRAETDEVDNVGAWLTTIVARVCLNMLRSRNRRRERSLEEHLPDPVVRPYGGSQPEELAVLADSVGLALLLVLDTLSPAERLAFVLHDTFDLPFAEIAPLVGRSEEATRQLASRARRRVKGAEVDPSSRDLARQREVVDAFVRAARGGDFEALLAVLDPDVVLREDINERVPVRVFHGPDAVARQARLGAVPGAEIRPAVVNGGPGFVAVVRDRPFALLAFTVRDGRIVAIDAIGGAERVGRVAAAVLGG